ncbi:MAG: hypothetical protein DME26_01330, partial [Verrucomicrobia bacterium]
WRKERQRNDIAIIRLEQLYPLRADLLEMAIAPYPADASVCWVQEEPENMGAWRHLCGRFGENLFGRRLQQVSRPESASPATGSAGAHKLEQEQLIRRAFEGASDVIKQRPAGLKNDNPKGVTHAH